MDFFTIIGLLGVTTVLVAYGMMTMDKWQANSARYQWLNVIGTSGILVSLLASWNLPAFVANILWIIIGAVSLVRIYRNKANGMLRRRAPHNDEAS
jgi:paired small multidrug resistance pump